MTPSPPRPPGAFKRWWLSFIQRRLNPLTLRMAHSGRGPFSLVRHVGRKSGRTFETPLILADSRDGIVAELTYGTGVNWYRNVVAGGGEVLHRGRWYRILAVEPLAVADGLRAFGPLKGLVLRVLRRREFRLLRVEPENPPADAAR
ncbi:hypothetical protein [Microbacterium yannicii]|uniref:hypothetical protein n=1 Tax=Microbacterium yannicii TaxID=671622 RepID=UPI0002E0DA75|nr:hypothetical protein [Microbacterium yannicii]